jgi:hypothetical protein
MPLHLEPLDVSVDLENYKSFLIVTCLTLSRDVSVDKGTA